MYQILETWLEENCAKNLVRAQFKEKKYNICI